MSKKKRILIVVANRDFRDEEYFIPADVFKKAGHKIETASVILGIAYGSRGGETRVDLLLDKVDINDYQALVFIGGIGARMYFDNSLAQRIIREAVEKEIVLGAICIAPAILAKAGVLKGKKATVWSSELDMSNIDLLKKEGASYENNDVVSDGKIITANGPKAALGFAQKIIEILEQ